MKKVIKSIMLLISSVLFKTQVILASSIGSSKLFTGSTRLAQDITTWITGAAAVFAILMIGYCFLRKMGAEPDKARQYNDRIKMIAGCLIGIIVLSSIIQIVISYFQ